MTLPQKTLELEKLYHPNTKNMHWYSTPKNLDASKPNLGLGRMDFMFPFIPYVFANDLYNGKELKDILVLSPGGVNLHYQDEYFCTYCLGNALELPYEHLEAEMKVYSYALHEGYELKLSCPLDMLEVADFVCFDISSTPSNPNRAYYRGYVVKVDYYKSILSKGFNKSWCNDNESYRGQLHPVLRHTTMSPQFLFDSFRDILVDVLNEETVRAIFTYFVETLALPSWGTSVVALKRSFWGAEGW